MSEWREVALGEVAEIAVGPAFKSAEFTETRRTSACFEE